MSGIGAVFRLTEAEEVLPAAGLEASSMIVGAGGAYAVKEAELVFTAAGSRAAVDWFGDIRTHESVLVL